MWQMIDKIDRGIRAVFWYWLALVIAYFYGHGMWWIIR